METTNTPRSQISTPNSSSITPGNENSSDNDDVSSGELCLVCGETNAAMHYGALACVGCKGFFRRALMKADQLECQQKNTCVINKDLRTNCRACRFRKCLAAGMKPAAVRPNRDYSARQKKKALALPAESVDCTANGPKSRDEWMKRMTVEMRTMLMTLLNIEAKIAKGDTTRDASQLYPLKVNTIREIMEDMTVLDGKRSQMRYEPYRMAKNDELAPIAYRRLIAAIDWVEYLAEVLGGLSIEDKIALVKNAFAPLMVFKFASRTAEVAQDHNILCLCNFAYVPRNISSAFADSYHLGNGLVGRALDELVRPYRDYGMREEEVVCISAIIILNPLARDLSPESFEKIMDLRNKIQDTLFTIVKEVRMSPQPSVCLGHLLLSLPIVTCLANAMSENLQFAQTFSAQTIPLLTDLFGCFPIEPFEDEQATEAIDQLVIASNPEIRATYEKGCQTEETTLRNRKRPHEVDDSDPQNFELLRPPCNFTLTEMFEEIQRDELETPEPFYFLQQQAATSQGHLPQSASSHSVQYTTNNYGSTSCFQGAPVLHSSNPLTRTHSTPAAVYGHGQHYTGTPSFSQTLPPLTSNSETPKYYAPQCHWNYY